eukprot:8349446-Karenia_brevis.AAC.1
MQCFPLQWYAESVLLEINFTYGLLFCWPAKDSSDKGGKNGKGQDEEKQPKKFAGLQAGMEFTLEVDNANEVVSFLVVERRKQA